MISVNHSTHVPAQACVQLLERLWGPDQEHLARLHFTCWLQWHLHRQLRHVSQYAAQRRVILKGDLPIGAPLLPHSIAQADHHELICPSWAKPITNAYTNLGLYISTATTSLYSLATEDAPMLAPGAQALLLPLLLLLLHLG